MNIFRPEKSNSPLSEMVWLREERELQGKKTTSKPLSLLRKGKEQEGRLFSKWTTQISAKLLPPCRKKQQAKQKIADAQFNQAIHCVVNGPLSRQRLEESERLLSRLASDSFATYQTRLWLGVTKRVHGLDTVDQFESLYREDPNDRMALINWGASWLTCFRGADKSEVKETYDALTDYATVHPEDPFARLVVALLDYRYFGNWQCQSIEILEQLYLDHRTYSPAISTLASILRGHQMYASAHDYADEAYRLRPDNDQARALINTNDDFRIRTEAVPWLCVHTSRHSQIAALCGPYGLQDPIGAAQWQKA